ncbi:hypothetical protein DY000_02018457 [Brassica cretica]|uniref:Uncharacterized protein n=1 Tax=Brassica cretica TaxID=69181 RepID=A0ABQ7D8U1_BRACR|nr:hypothetical protein DY000_02018457 [Brassica cretica]
MFFIHSISLFLLLQGNSGSTEYHKLVPPFPYSVELRLSYFNRSSMASQRQLHNGSLCHRRRSFHSSPIRCREEEGSESGDDKAKKKKKRKRDSDEYYTKPAKDYYLDTRPDPDNLAYGSIYRCWLEQCKFFCVFLPAETFVLGSNQCGVKTCDSRSMIVTDAYEMTLVSLSCVLLISHSDSSLYHRFCVLFLLVCQDKQVVYN